MSLNALNISGVPVDFNFTQLLSSGMSIFHSLPTEAGFLVHPHTCVCQRSRCPDSRGQSWALVFLSLCRKRGVLQRGVCLHADD